VSREQRAQVDAIMRAPQPVPRDLLDEADQALDRAALFLRHHRGTVGA
jgi:hypothetical protein